MQDVACDTCKKEMDDAAKAAALQMNFADNKQMKDAESQQMGFRDYKHRLEVEKEEKEHPQKHKQGHASGSKHH